MKIIIGGGTGFVGRTLVPELLKAGHHITVVGRDTDKISRTFSANVATLSWRELSNCQPDDYDAVINLAGANISGRRWTEAYKSELLSSRVQSTLALVEWCESAHTRKPHLYNASAIGYYGLQSVMKDQQPACTENDIVDDQTDTSFSGNLVRAWERAALSSDSIKVTVMRFGVVLRRGEGMLKQLELPAKFGLGAVVGSGKQPLTWIDADDLVSAMIFLLEHPAITGVVNLTALEVVTQKQFTHAMSDVLHKPSLLWLPAIVVKMLFGQMGVELLLSGQAVYPLRLQELHFKFKYPTLQSALQHEYSGK